MSNMKTRCRKYSAAYLKFEFILSWWNTLLPMCLLYIKVLSNKAMESSRFRSKKFYIFLSQDFTQVFCVKCTLTKKNKDLVFFINIRDTILKIPFQTFSQPHESNMMMDYKSIEPDFLTLIYKLHCYYYHSFS